VDVNEAFLEFVGYQRDEVIGRTSQELDFWVDPIDRHRMIAILYARMQAAGIWRPSSEEERGDRLGADVGFDD
jgi:PAS domain S-box-containing protein